jgi:RimJ/RimL family protein N-acetyltransferase
MGYVADVDHESQGSVSEAVRAVLRCLVFGPLQAHRVSLRCDDANERSIQVAERCGFKREAHLRENKRAPDGSLTGTFVYALLCREFEALDRKSEL